MSVDITRLLTPMLFSLVLVTPRAEARSPQELVDDTVATANDAVAPVSEPTSFCPSSLEADPARFVVRGDTAVGRRAEDGFALLVRSHVIWVRPVSGGSVAQVVPSGVAVPAVESSYRIHVERGDVVEREGRVDIISASGHRLASVTSVASSLGSGSRLSLVDDDVRIKPVDLDIVPDETGGDRQPTEINGTSFGDVVFAGNPGPGVGVCYDRAASTLNLP